VWAFAIQNEARGHMPDFHAPWTWHCGRAKLIRPLINQTIYVTTGTIFISSFLAFHYSLYLSI
jgi:hypothetical protein